MLLMQLRYKWCVVTARNSSEFSSSKPEKSLVPVLGYQFLVACDSSTHFLLQISVTYLEHITFNVNKLLTHVVQYALYFN